MVASNGKPKKPAQVLKERVATPAKTAGYEPAGNPSFWQRPRDLPLFSFLWIRMMLMEPTIRLGLKMRAAPLYAAEFAYKQGKEWTPGIQAERDEVGAFVLRTLQRIWAHHLGDLLQSQIWGWAGGEATWKLSEANLLEFVSYLPRRAEDVRCRVQEGEIKGVEIKRVVGKGTVNLDMPRGFFTAYAPEAGDFYGTSALYGAFSPWADKWLNGGALDVRRLFMTKDAYRGSRRWYPDREYKLPNGQLIHARELMRMNVEQITSGGVETYPSEYDEHGNPLWKAEDAQVTANPAHILQYPKDCDGEMLRGMDIPDDVLSADNSGSWEGKKVPMCAFYAGLDVWLAQVLRDVRKYNLDPIIKLNFGTKGTDYEIRTKPLAVQAMEQQGESKQDPAQQNGTGRPPQIPLPQRMSLDPVEAVGEGVLSAAELAKAARMALDAAMPETHEFSCLLFNLPGELADAMRQLSLSIPDDDLAADGREMDPHITVKFGLHSNDAEEVRRAIQDEPPVGIQFGEASCFSSAEHDVVKIEIQSNGLRELNRKVSKSLQCTDTYPEYKPHATIAYVKPGLGEDYAKRLNGLAGRTAIFDRVTFSDKQRQHTSIPLLGRATRLAVRMGELRKYGKGSSKPRNTEYDHIEFGLDAQGREHAPAGTSEGGQFVSKGGKQLTARQKQWQDQREKHGALVRNLEDLGRAGTNWRFRIGDTVHEIPWASPRSPVREYGPAEFTPHKGLDYYAVQKLIEAGHDDPSDHAQMDFITPSDQKLFEREINTETAEFLVYHSLERQLEKRPLLPKWGRAINALMGDPDSETFNADALRENDLLSDEAYAHTDAIASKVGDSVDRQMGNRDHDLDATLEAHDAINEMKAEQWRGYIDRAASVSEADLAAFQESVQAARQEGKSQKEVAKEVIASDKPWMILRLPEALAAAKKRKRNGGDSGIRLSTDANGMEHNGPGDGGGQFAKQGEASEKPKNVRKPRKLQATHETIGELVSHVTSKPTKGNDAFVDYAVVSEKEAAAIHAATGLDVAGYFHTIDEAGVLHIVGGHGEGTESGIGHNPVSHQDIARIPEIVATADKISLAGKTDAGADLIRYQKRENGHTFVVEEVRTGRRKLVAKSMWKIAGKKDGDKAE